MPITVTIPNRSNTKSTNAASRLSSRKLLDIATDAARAKSDSVVQSAIVELQQRKHYLSELEARGLLKRLLLTPQKRAAESVITSELTQSGSEHHRPYTQTTKDTSKASVQLRAVTKAIAIDVARSFQSPSDQAHCGRADPYHFSLDATASRAPTWQEASLCTKPCLMPHQRPPNYHFSFAISGAWRLSMQVLR